MSIPPDIFAPAQLVGYVAFLITIIAFWQKNDRRLLLLNALGATVFTTHYILLGALVGAATETLVALRSFASAYPNDPKRKALFALLFTVAFFAVGIYFFRVWYDVISIITCIMATLVMIYLRGLGLRFGMLAVLTCWLAYNALVGSIGGVLTATALIIIQILTIIRMRRDRANLQVAAIV